MREADKERIAIMDGELHTLIEGSSVFDDKSIFFEESSLSMLHRE